MPPLSELWLTQCQSDLETLIKAHGCALKSLDNSPTAAEQPRKRKRGVPTTNPTRPNLEQFRNWLASMEEQLLRSPPNFKQKSEDAIKSGLVDWQNLRNDLQRAAQPEDSDVTLMTRGGGQTADCVERLKRALEAMGTSAASLLRSLDVMVEVIDFTEYLQTSPRVSSNADSTGDEDTKLITEDLYMLEPCELRALEESELNGSEYISAAVLGGSSLVFVALAERSQAKEKGMLSRPNFIKVRLVPANEELDSKELYYSTHIRASADHGASFLDYELYANTPRSCEDLTSNVFSSEQVRGLDQKIVEGLCEDFDSWARELDNATDPTEEDSTRNLLLYEARESLRELSKAYSQSRKRASERTGDSESTG